MAGSIMKIKNLKEHRLIIHYSSKGGYMGKLLLYEKYHKMIETEYRVELMDRKLLPPIGTILTISHK